VIFIFLIKTEKILKNPHSLAMCHRKQARAIEQTIIDNKSGTYQNKINSISPNNPIFNGVKEWGNNFLNQLGLGKNLE
jgi:hypothetical protein